MEHEIVLDLLPLYRDGVCSAASRAAVEAHLETCGACRKALADMDAPLPETERQAADDAAAVKKISKEWKGSKRRAWLKGAVAAAAVCLVLVGLWMLATEWKIIPADPEKIEATDLSQLSDGRLIYHLRIDDDRNLYSLRWEFGEEGDVWIVPRRALFTPRRDRHQAGVGVDLTLSFPILRSYAQSDGVDAELVRIWCGKGEDAVLLWEEGMDVPAAIAADEEAYGYSEASAAYWAAREKN